VQPCRYYFYSVVQKWVFCPTGATRCPDKCEIWHGERTFTRAKMWEYSPQNCQNLPLRGHSFAQFLRNSQILYASPGYKQPSYKHFPMVGAFSLKFLIAPSGKTTERIKKLGRCKNGTDLLYHHAKYGGYCGSRAGCRRKSVMFFCSFFCHALESRSL